MCIRDSYESSEYVRASGYLESVDVPIVMVSAEVDHFVVTGVNQEVCDTRFPKCKRLDLIGAGHCLFQESDAHLKQMFDSLDGLTASILGAGSEDN